MSTFPTARPAYLGFTATHTLAADTHAAQHNQEQADIGAMSDKIGLGASAPAVGQVLTGNGTGTSSWSQVNLTTMVSGVLPVANGGTGTTSTTGTGSVVYGNSPSLTGASLASPSLTNATSNNEILTGQPTITDFTNAIHSHNNNAGGGQIDFAALLSTIFSGQLQTQANSGSAGGTMYYINLGGIKLLWCLTGTLSVSGSTFQSTTYLVTFPVGFFSSIQACQGTPTGTPSGSQYLSIAGAQAVNASNWSFDFNQNTGTNGSTTSASIFVIGT